LYDTIKGENPNVKFGISPFGMWKNKSSDVTGSAASIYPFHNVSHATYKAGSLSGSIQISFPHHW